MSITDLQTMHPFKGETEDETLRKLETFNWNRKVTATVIIDDEETTHQTVTNQDNSSVGEASTNYSQDTSGKQNESNPQISLPSGHIQITRTGETKIKCKTQIPPIQQNENYQSFEFMSHNLILILRKFDSSPNYNECLEFKKNIFTLLKSMVSNIIVPRMNDRDFITKLLRDTISIGVASYNYYISYLGLGALFYEMVNFAKQSNHSETERNQNNLSSLDKLENITVSSYFNAPITNISNKNTAQNAKRRKTKQYAKGKANESNEKQYAQVTMNSSLGSFVERINFGKHYNHSNDQNNIKQQVQLTAASGAPPPPYPIGLNEVAMSPVSLDGDNNDVQGFEVPTLNPSISFVTSLNPERTPVADGYCRICNKVTNRICIGCSKINAITYYCSQTCQEREWPRHMFHCWKSI